MTKYLQIFNLNAETFKRWYFDDRRQYHTAGCADFNAMNGPGRVYAYCHRRFNRNHCGGGACVYSQFKDYGAFFVGKFGFAEDNSFISIKVKFIHRLMPHIKRYCKSFREFVFRIFHEDVTFFTKRQEFSVDVISARAMDNEFSGDRRSSGFVHFVNCDKQPFPIVSFFDTSYVHNFITSVKKIAFDYDLLRFSVVRKVFYTFLHHKTISHNMKKVNIFKNRKIEKNRTLDGGLRCCNYLLNNLRQLSAVRILKGRLACRDRKCLFSVTKASTPRHSAYAAIKASVGFRPLLSYSKTISNGTTMSSSIVIAALTKLLNSWKAYFDKFRFTSSNIVRGMRIVCRDRLSDKLSISWRAADSSAGPNAKIYSLESMTKRNLFLPDSLSGFTQGLYNFIFAHLKNRGRVPGNYFSKSFQMFFSFSDIFHYNSPPM